MITPKRHEDARGYFSETFRQDWFRANVAEVGFVQDNQSFSQRAGTVRGLHYQSPPSDQGKLVRSLSGAIFDVAVDIRKYSPSYGRWTSAILTADEGNQLWIPSGFLHGFCTLTPETLVSYKVTAYYDADCDMGVRWDDPEIAVSWPDIADPSLLSRKDAALPSLDALPAHFHLAKGS